MAAFADQHFHTLSRPVFYWVTRGSDSRHRSRTSAPTPSPLRTLPILCFLFPPILLVDGTLDEAGSHLNHSLFYWQIAPVFFFKLFILGILFALYSIPTRHAPLPALSSHT